MKTMQIPETPEEALKVVTDAKWTTEKDERWDGGYRCIAPDKTETAGLWKAATLVLADKLIEELVKHRTLRDPQQVDCDLCSAFFYPPDDGRPPICPACRTRVDAYMAEHEMDEVNALANLRVEYEAGDDNA